MRPQLSSGEHVVLHLFVKAVRLNGSVAVRGVGWAESADRVHYHALHLEFLRQPGDVVRDALQPKFLYLRETGVNDAREHDFRVEVLSHAILARQPCLALSSRGLLWSVLQVEAARLLTHRLGTHCC